MWFDTVQTAMKLPDDNFPLLHHVYAHARAPQDRCTNPPRLAVAQTATAILGRWPSQMIFGSLLAIVGTISFLVALVVVTILLTSGTCEKENQFVVNQCDRARNEALELESIYDNKVYFVELQTGELNMKRSACAIESFLASMKNNSPVYYIHIGDKQDLLQLTSQNIRPIAQLSKRYKNLNLFFFNTKTFFQGTIFEKLINEDPKFLKFLAKLQVAWTLRGVVMDTNWLTIRPSERRESCHQDAVLGLYQSELVFIDVKHYCHSFIFELMKVAVSSNLRESGDVIHGALLRFCQGRETCAGVKILGPTLTCTSVTKNANCTFLKLDDTMSGLNKTICSFTSQPYD